jgi:putative ABC transport system permease protein
MILERHAAMGFAQGEENFIPFYQMKLIAGRNISHSDSLRDLAINETYSNLLGFKTPADAVGKILYRNDKSYPIAGVIADFHQGSFHEAIHPAVIGKIPERESSLAIKLDATEKKQADVKIIAAAMEKEWKKIYPEEPFNYDLLNEAITWLYGQEENTSWLVNAAVAISIFISCMGLFGLVMFTAKRRIKEIGIRKVLGASVTDIASMLSKDFVSLVLIALIIASPIAWYLMHKWLQDFVYRTNISVWIFAVSGLAGMIIAVLTISTQAIKAAIANPVDALRTE